MYGIASFFIKNTVIIDVDAAYCTTGLASPSVWVQIFSTLFTSFQIGPVVDDEDDGSLSSLSVVQFLC